ncbi:MAG: O-antigen ligase family protein [Nannocystaceae bacterium]
MQLWSRLPLGRLGLGFAIGGPALALGGVPPQVVPIFLVVVALLWLRLTSRLGGRVRRPWGLEIGLFAAALTFVQWMPLPMGGAHWLASAFMTHVDAGLEGTGLPSWSRISVVPGNTGLEVGRLLGLVLLFVAAAQMSWRVPAFSIVAAAVVVAGVGLVHELSGTQAIYGVYWPRERGMAAAAELVTCFVNPNHQSSLFLLAIFSGLALAAHQREAVARVLPPIEHKRALDRMWAAWGAVAFLVFALVLSLSRAALITAMLVAFVARVCVGNSGNLGPNRDDHGSSRWRRAGVLVVVLLLLAVVGSHGAWEQLETLGDPGNLQDKYAVVIDALGLIPISPLLGVGRGAFVDAYPVLGSAPGSALYTHAENAPVAMIVEWGPVFGGGIAIALARWWVVAWRAAEGRGPRLALLGLLAVAVHNLADFNLEYLGVAAGVCALAGSLSPTARRARFRVAPRWPGLALLAAGFAIAIVSLDGTWSSQRAWKRGYLQQAARPELLSHLHYRPLDPAIHLALARRAAEASDWSEVKRRATTVERLRPTSPDAYLLHAAAFRAGGDTGRADEATRSALSSLRQSPSDELVEYLLAAYPDPERFGDVLPQGRDAFRRLVTKLVRIAPAHAEVMARRWEARHPDDAVALSYRARAALARSDPPSALHFARLYAQSRPDLAAAHALLATALRAQAPSREREVAASLRAALGEALDKPGRVEELLLRSYLLQANFEDPEEILRIAARLARRHASPGVLKRRAAIIRKIRAQTSSSTAGAEASSE